MALVSSVARVAGFAAPLAAGEILTASDGDELLPCAIGFVLLTAVAAALLPIETRGRKID